MDLPPLQPVDAANPLVFMDVCIGQELAGRLIIELRKDVVPKTAENFRALCTGEKGIGQLGKPLHYKGVRFHKVQRVFAARSGDIINNDGTSGESIYGPRFEDENFILTHEEGVVSMANYGIKDSNNSQFAITSVQCDNLNGANVVVGKVLRGLGVIHDMEQNTNDEGEPSEAIVIKDCGEIAPGSDWGYVDTDEAGIDLPHYPQDWDNKMNAFTLDEILKILVTIRASGNGYFAQCSHYEARRKYRKAHRYYLWFKQRYNMQEYQHLKFSQDDGKALDEFAALNHVNMAAVELKLRNYGNARYECNEALRLDENCAKGYYRRGQANVGLKCYEDAISDFSRALQLVPNEKSVLNELNKSKKLLQDYNRVQMEALKNLFA